MKKYKTLLLVGIIGLIPLGMGMISTNANAEDPQQVEQQQQKEYQEAKENSVANAVLGDDIFKQINNALEKKEKLSKEKLDELTWYMVEYNSKPQYVSATGDVSLSEEGFRNLLNLYAQSGVDPSFELNDDNIKMLRDIKKPNEADKTLKDAKEDAKEAIIDSKAIQETDSSKSEQQ